MRPAKGEAFFALNNTNAPTTKINHPADNINLVLQKIAAKRNSIVNLERTFKEYVSFKRAQLQPTSGGKSLDFDGAEQWLSKALLEFQDKQHQTQKKEKSKESSSKENETAVRRKIEQIRREFDELSTAKSYYPQVLRQFNCLGDVLFADMLYGKYFVSIHSGGVMEIWQSVPKIKAAEHIVFPAEIGTLTAVHRIKNPGEAESSVNQMALNQGQEFTFVMSTYSGSVHFMQLKFKWSEEKRMPIFHRIIHGASQKVSDTPIRFLEIGCTSTANFITLASFAPHFTQEYLIGLNEKLEEQWSLSVDQIKAIGMTKIDGTFPVEKVKRVSTIASISSSHANLLVKPKIQTDDDFSLNSLSIDHFNDRLILLLKTGDMLVLKRVKQNDDDVLSVVLSGRLRVSIAPPNVFQNKEIRSNFPNHNLSIVGSSNQSGLYRYFMVSGTDGPVLGYNNNANPADILRLPMHFQFIQETLDERYTSNLAYTEQIKHFRVAERVCAIAFFTYQDLPLMLGLTTSGMLSFLRVSEAHKPILMMHTGLGRLKQPSDAHDVRRAIPVGLDDSTSSYSSLSSEGSLLRPPSQGNLLPPSRRVHHHHHHDHAHSTLTKMTPRPFIQVLVPGYICLCSLGGREWVALDLKPSLLYYFKLG